MAEKSPQENNPDMHKCKICHLNFDDIHKYTEHLESKAHEKALMKKKYGLKYLEAKEMLDEKNNTNTLDDSLTNGKENVVEDSKEETNHDKINNEVDGVDDSDEDDDVYTCDTCEKICTGILNYKLHLAGNKHRKKVRQLKFSKEIDEKNSNSIDYTPPNMEILDQIMLKKKFKASERVCEQCNVSCSGPEALLQHLKGEAHKKRVEKEEVKKKLEKEGITANAKEEIFGERYSCEICQKYFSGLKPYSQHMDSISHLKQERDLKLREKRKDEFVKLPKTYKIQCKECKKTFSGPNQLEEHLSGPSHSKMKNKESLYKELKEKFPEMVSTTLDDSASDNEVEYARPACNICHVIFSGPEAAHDHFNSEKHKKAKKKKKLIEKNKTAKKTEVPPKNVTVSETKANSEENESSSDGDFEKISG